MQERYKWSFQLCHREPSVNAFRASEVRGGQGNTLLEMMPLDQKEIELKFAEADSDCWPVNHSSGAKNFDRLTTFKRTVYIQLPLEKEAKVYMKDTKDNVCCHHFALIL